MNAIDCLLIAGIVLGIVGICVHLVRQKKSGKGGCGCGCKTCPVADKCKGEQKKND